MPYSIGPYRAHWAHDLKDREEQEEQDRENERWRRPRRDQEVYLEEIEADRERQLATWQQGERGWQGQTNTTHLATAHGQRPSRRPFHPYDNFHTTSTTDLERCELWRQAVHPPRPFLVDRPTFFSTECASFLTIMDQHDAQIEHFLRIFSDEFLQYMTLVFTPDSTPDQTQMSVLWLLELSYDYDKLIRERTQLETRHVDWVKEVGADTQLQHAMGTIPAEVQWWKETLERGRPMPFESDEFRSLAWSPIVTRRNGRELNRLVSGAFRMSALKVGNNLLESDALIPGWWEMKWLEVLGK